MPAPGRVVPEESADAVRTVVVFVPPSAAPAFRALAADFEKLHPGVRVELDVAGTSTHAHRILEGAECDVFAASDWAGMEQLNPANVLGEDPRVFARNRLAIAVEAGNPKRIQTLADLARPGLTIALVAPELQAGRDARAAFAKARVAVPHASNESDVEAVLEKVALGVADAGIVNATDRSNAKVELVRIPDAENVVSPCPIAFLRGGRERELGRAFVLFVLSPDGARTLTRFGFLSP